MANDEELPGDAARRGGWGAGEGAAPPGRGWVAGARGPGLRRMGGA
ncbi:MAG TPA: hypothetical protein VHQ90_11400 [Thermoanaerobaculia bacterium]|nr:hypothetical protein [Thermoanaerobaculia bacterium]